MTGYATRDGAQDGLAWTWEMRSVNARGLDIRLRLPDGYGGLEASLRKALSSGLARGAVTLNLRLSRSESAGDARVDAEALAGVLAGLAQIQASAEENGVPLVSPSAADIYALNGVAGMGDGPEGPTPDRLMDDIAPLLEAFLAMRQTEGVALKTVLDGQLSRVSALVEQAQKAATARSESQAERFRANVAAILDGAEGLDPQRIAQEVAILAVKSDVTEEIDRLGAHVTAARDLLSKGGPVGRKLDFLMQEFNREANTLCAKSGDAALTAIGLDLKLTIDQMREQVQNLE